MVRTVGSLFLLSVLFGFTQANASISAPPSIIDFNGLSPVPQGFNLDLVVDGVAVNFNSTAGLQISDLLGRRFLHSIGFQTPITVTFGGGFTAAFVEVDNVFFDFGNVITGEAFDTLGSSLDNDTTTDQILHLDGPGIASVIYSRVGTGYSLDNFTFAAVIPEPSSFLIASFLLAISARMPRSLRRR